MILVVVGTQLAFDRLVRTVDLWAGRHGRKDIIAQVGPSSYQAQHITTRPFLRPCEFRQQVAAASLVVSHAGMGTIITALEMGKPIVVMPRRADFGEHRNDHQIATAKRFLAQGRIEVAFNKQDLYRALDTLETVIPAERIGSQASAELLNVIAAFLGDSQRVGPT